MSITILKKIKIAPISLCPADTLRLSYNDKEIMTANIEESFIADTAIIFKVEDEYGLENGIGGIVAKEKNTQGGS